jgi:hypothetical protein
MSTNLNSAENNFLFSYQTKELDDIGLPLLLPRSAWDNQVTYLKVLFRVKKRLDQIDAANTHCSEKIHQSQ